MAEDITTPGTIIKIYPNPMDTRQQYQDKDEAAQSEKPLTRAQRRHQEQVSEEAGKAFEQISMRFVDFFTQCNDPEGVEVVEKMDQMDAQWRLYCSRKSLSPKAYPLLEDYMRACIEEYKKPKQPDKIDETVEE